MNFRPNPLLYGAGEDFYSTFQLVVTMRFDVDIHILSQAVDRAMARYPYFSIRPMREGHRILLQSNPLPVPIFPDDRNVTLGTDESNGHLLTFGCSGNNIFLNASHYIADGMGIMPLLKTVVYLYASAAFGAECPDAGGIRLPEDPVPEAEYAYPFPETPVECDARYLPRKAPETAYAPDAEAFDKGGLYAYHLRIPQKVMMAKANTSDGSPISFLSVMLYRALCRLDPGIDLPVVGHVQHQYRAALKTPLSHHSLVSYIPVVLPPRAANWPVEQQNTALRGQIILGSEEAADLNAVNRLLNACPAEDTGLDAKQQAMARYARNSTLGKTFGISYMGRLDWSGLDRYVEDLHAYIGEKHARNMILIEVMTIGEDFSLNFMQGGKGTQYLQAFIDQLGLCGIPARLTGEGRYTLCDTRIPR